jgi:hypothetical protein
VDLEALASEFRPILIRSGGDVLRADHCYVEREGRALLLEALVVESGRKLPFYVKVTRHDRGSATVRVDPMTHPERSEGVRALVARVAVWLLESTPGARPGRANVVLPSGTRKGGTDEGGPS